MPPSGISFTRKSKSAMPLQNRMQQTATVALLLENSVIGSQGWACPCIEIETLGVPPYRN